MALQKAYTKEVFGKTLTFNEAYFQINYLSGTKESLTLGIIIYNNKQKENKIDSKNYSFIPDISDSAKNFYKQGYEYLKTKPEFEGAIDVLEDGQMA